MKIAIRVFSATDFSGYPLVYFWPLFSRIYILFLPIYNKILNYEQICSKNGQRDMKIFSFFTVRWTAHNMAVY